MPKPDMIDKVESIVSNVMDALFVSDGLFTKTPK